MYEERELLIRMKRDFILANRRSEDYPDDHPDKQMNAWLAEDISRFIEVVEAYQESKDGIYYELERLHSDTPFQTLRQEIRRYSNHLRAAEEREEAVRSRYVL